MATTYFGMELGSTRIKSVLTDVDSNVIASGSHTWDNKLAHGLWTYSEQEIFDGIRASFADLIGALPSGTDADSMEIAAMGFSGMMHGYIALDADGKLLTPFRTWRNTNTGAAAAALTELFGFNIPMRWSIAHLYQAILDGEPHVKHIAHLTTLAGYVHYKLTGEKVLGVGEASGMFPIDSATCDYNARMVAQFDQLVADRGYGWKLRDVLPRVQQAGCSAGKLTKEGASLLDPTGWLSSGIALCPPEGDAGTGMVATNSVKPTTGNVSAGTSVFAMAVLQTPLKHLHTEIDMVTTPDGAPVAMVHCNNCTSDLNAWAALFGELARAVGADVPQGNLMTMLFECANKGDADCGGLINYNYLSGEPLTGFESGRPLFLREADGRLTLGNFMKTQIYASLATLALGMKILADEGARVGQMCGHGGFFKTPCVGQSAMSAAVGAPVTVLDNAGEGGAWGIALLARYMCAVKDCGETTLGAFLDGVFSAVGKTTMEADAQEQADFAAYLKRYQAYLTAERAAVEVTFC